MKDAQYIVARIKELAKDKKVSVNKLLTDCHMNPTLVSDMHRRGTIPSVDTVYKIAEYFDVPVNFLIGNPPFNCWEQINTENGRGTFLFCTGIEDDLFWRAGIIINLPQTVPLHKFIWFIEAVAKDVAFNEDRGTFQVTLRRDYLYRLEVRYDDPEKRIPEETPQETREQEHRIAEFDDFIRTMYEESRSLTDADKKALLDMAHVLKMQHLPVPGKEVK